MRKKVKKALDSQDVVWYSKQVAQDVPAQGASDPSKKLQKRRTRGKKRIDKGHRIGV
jgi:hypothetical protein